MASVHVSYAMADSFDPEAFARASGIAATTTHSPPCSYDTGEFSRGSATTVGGIGAVGNDGHNSTRYRSHNNGSIRSGDGGSRVRVEGEPATVDNGWLQVSPDLPTQLQQPLYPQLPSSSRRRVLEG